MSCIRKRENAAVNGLELNRRLAKGKVELAAVKVFGAQAPDVVMRTRQLHQGRQRIRGEGVAIRPDKSIDLMEEHARRE